MAPPSCKHEESSDTNTQAELALWNRRPSMLRLPKFIPRDRPHRCPGAGPSQSPGRPPPGVSRWSSFRITSTDGRSPPAGPSRSAAVSGPRRLLLLQSRQPTPSVRVRESARAQAPLCSWATEDVRCSSDVIGELVFTLKKSNCETKHFLQENKLRISVT